MKIKLSLDQPIQRRCLHFKMKIRRSLLSDKVKNAPIVNSGRDYLHTPSSARVGYVV
jgi:hypothetical protein